MSLQEEIADLREAVSQILHHGLPKSETTAKEMVEQIHSHIDKPTGGKAA